MGLAAKSSSAINTMATHEACIARREHSTHRGDKTLVLCQRVPCTALAPDLWDDRITSRRVPPAFDPQGPRQPDEAVVVALVVQIQACHSRPTCGRRPHNPLRIRRPRKMRGPAEFISLYGMMRL